MKIYLFYPETGVYLGEYFADEVPVTCCSPVVPHKTTTIAPPVGGRGHLLHFDAVAQCWEVHTHCGQEDPQQTYPAEPPRKGVHCYSGSILVFIGFMLWFAALCDDNKDIGVMCGLSLIFGTVAIISLKERMLDTANNTRLRRCLELSAIIFIILGYLWDLRTPGINNAVIALNSVTPVTSIALYCYFLSSWMKRVHLNRNRSRKCNSIHS
jgi:hypothetical protein